VETKRYVQMPLDAMLMILFGRDTTYQKPKASPGLPLHQIQSAKGVAATDVVVTAATTGMVLFASCDDDDDDCWLEAFSVHRTAVWRSRDLESEIGHASPTATKIDLKEYMNILVDCSQYSRK
jgi:hypothetical protein